MRRGLLVLLAVSLAACGSGSDSQSNSPPSCSSVWVQGRDLPKSYNGCVDGSRRISVSTQACTKDPGRTLVLYGTSHGLYAAERGGKIAMFPGSNDATDGDLVGSTIVDC